jgi:hypothetical protein
LTVSEDYAAAYSRCLRYSRETVPLLLKEMATDPEHARPGSNLRLALADALREAGRPDVADHAASHLPMSVRDGKPQLSTLRLHRMLSQMVRYYGGEHIQGGDPTPLRLEAAAELDRVGRSHEAAILRSQHPIDTHAVAHRYDHRDSGYSSPRLTVTGDYPRFVHGGGELVYHTRDGGLLCHNCANGENRSDSLDPSEDADPRSQFAHDGNRYHHEEGGPINCDHCGREVHSAYGDPDQPDEDR